MTNQTLAFVLSGGGSRGALQVGALYALLEHNLQPNLLVGTSIGAMNATYLAMKGFSKEALDGLTALWHEVTKLDLMPANYVWLAMRRVLGRATSSDPAQRIQDFCIAHGVTPDLRFKQIGPPRLVIVSSDLNTGKPVMHGGDPEDAVLEALLVSTAVPPWFMPVKRRGQYLMDGMAVSNLPVEPAYQLGATKIIALDLLDTRETPGLEDGVGSFLDRLSMTVIKRQGDLELALAEARGLPVLYVDLVGKDPIPVWDFHHTDEMIDEGYAITRRVLTENPAFLTHSP